MFEATLPLLTIMAAPASLCLTGYLTMNTNPSWAFSLVMVLLAQGLYWGTLTKIFKYIRLSFYPSFGAFTFPLVISATALNLFNNSFHLANGFNAIIGVVANLEITLATFMVVFVVIKYGQFLISLASQAAQEKKVAVSNDETITK